MNRITTTAVVLRTLDYGESDRIVTLFTEEMGKVAAFARGAKRSKRRFAGALEPFTLLDVDLVERRPDSMLRLESCTIRDAFWPIREDYDRIVLASYLTELVLNFAREGEANPALLQLLIGSLAGLGVSSATGREGAKQRRIFELRLLALQGYRPCLDRCVICGSDPGEDARFAATRGGVLCPACPATPDAVHLDRRAREQSETILCGGTGELAGEVVAPVGRAVDRFVEEILGKKLRSARFLGD